MKRFIGLFLAATLCISALAACAPQYRHQEPQTFEEQEAQRAKVQCEREATAMNGSGIFTSNNPLWDSYFVMCMHRLGVTDAQLKNMWY